MRIAIFTDTYPPYVNGVSTSCYNLANILTKQGHEVLVVAPRFTEGKLEQIGNVLYIPGVYLKRYYGFRMTNIFATKPVKIIKKFKPDIIHNQTDWTIGVLARRIAHKFRLPIVYTYHTSYEDYTYYVVRGFMEPFAKKLMRSYAKLIADRMTEFITPSDKTKDYMRNAGSDVYVNVIPSGICGMIYSDTWEKEVGKLDSVYLYILSYDLLFPDGNWHFIEDTKELNQEVFIARLSYKFLDLYDCHTHYCGTVVFPPPLDSDVPAIWYNGYSAEDFAVEEK